jgi:hypothetical protein
MSNVEQRIRERAYRIWLEEGCPEGREKDHWDMATELVAIGWTTGNAETDPTEPWSYG